jgi:hypothetical protein
VHNWNGGRGEYRPMPPGGKIMKNAKNDEYVNEKRGER